ncbi:MAG: alpha/beta hydrolase [Caldilineae bacterium]|nr:MAG: alpha/beta hydrolase [Caldilineae bacterium]
MTEPTTTTLHSADGFSLFCRAWPAEGDPRATLAIVHGLGEHSGRYDHTARYFAERGYAVFAVDLRGHGQSEGRRGHINRFDDYLTDVTTLLDHARRQTPDRPLFLLGHSMGGLIVLVYALKHPDGLTAVVASGPGLRARVHVPAWKTTLANLMASVAPTLAMSNGLDPADISRDRAVVDAYIADPLVHDRVTARWYTEFTAAGDWAMANASRFPLPLLIVQGGSDPIVDPAGAKAFFDRVARSDKRHIEYTTLYHEVFNEPEKLDVLADVENWLSAYCPA